MRKFYCIVIMVVTTIIFFTACAPGRCGFSINKSYTAIGFDSKSISGRSVIVMPLLKKQGVDTVGPFSDTSLLRKISDVRRDLHFIPFREKKTGMRFLRSDTINTFIKNLFNGNISVLQTADSVWEHINTDFMCVFRLNGGHIIRTFNGDTRKKINLEGELWDCRKAEVVIRVTVNGICVNPDISDGRFIVDGVKEIVKEFPLSSPAYDTQAW